MESTLQIQKRFSENQAVNLVLANAELRAADEGAPSSFYVAGHILNGAFAPDSGVLGDGAFEAQGTKGWLELANGRFHSDLEGVGRTSPFVFGVKTSQGFVPSSRKVE
jgi:hypothetical protein